MKNDYCDMSESEIHLLPVPDAVKGILLSPFQHNRMGGFVHVPEETFKEMVDLIAQHVSKPRKVKLPQRWKEASYDDEMYLTEMEGGEWVKADEVIEALRAAGAEVE